MSDREEDVERELCESCQQGRVEECKVHVIDDYMDGLRSGSIKQCRYLCYKLYIKRVHGCLGEGNRVPLPTCVEKAIKRRFPDSNNKYTGYKHKHAGNVL
jgi:hypothetical protein